MRRPSGLGACERSSVPAICKTQDDVGADNESCDNGDDWHWGGLSCSGELTDDLPRVWTKGSGSNSEHDTIQLRCVQHVEDLLRLTRAHASGDRSSDRAEDQVADNWH
jgi:hypothetical protein